MPPTKRSGFRNETMRVKPYTASKPTTLKNTDTDHELFDLIESEIDALQGLIDSVKITKPDFTELSSENNPLCPFAQHCVRGNPSHFHTHAHPIYDEYLLQISGGIKSDVFIRNIRQIIHLTYKGYKKYPDTFMDEWRIRIARLKLHGATQESAIPIGMNKTRYFPENTVYFYLMANLHKYFDDYAGKKYYDDKRFFVILFMRMEEFGDATGLYQMTPYEYNTIFEPRINISSLEPGDNYKGINIEPSKFISLANTTMMASFQKKLEQKQLSLSRVRTSSDAGGGSRASAGRRFRKQMRRITRKKTKRSKRR
jgi:hypothetical protein